MKKAYKAKGLHCVACEALLEDELKKLPDVSSASVSHKTGIIELSIPVGKKIDDSEVENIIKESGYGLDKSEPEGVENKKSASGLFQNVMVFVLMGLALYLISFFDLSHFFPDTSEGISVLAALGIGLVASVSTCLALTGGLVIGFSANIRKEDADAGLATLARPQIFFHIGRLTAFFLLGGALGLLGEAIGYSLHIISMLSFLVAFVMLYLGLEIMGILPSISSLGLHLPKSWTQKIRQGGKNTPLILGALTFFLPCGFTQSMQLLAVASGSFLDGGLIMLLFALGTLPVLFAVGLGASFTNQARFALGRKFIGALIIFFALFSFRSALLVAGFDVPFFASPKKTSESTTLNDNEDYQVVRMDLDYYFMQEEFRIKKDIPVRWEINAINISGCSNEVIIPRLGISSGKLKKGLNVVKFTPTESGVLPFSCWMGMLSGRFIVE